MTSLIDHGGAVAVNYGVRQRIGMILRAENVVAEPQIAAMLPPGVSLHTTRIRMMGPEKLSVLDRLEESAQLLADARVDRIVFHCTGTSMWRPELPAQINARIGAATSLPSFTTADAVLAALRALEAKNVVLLTPYPQVTNDHERELLARNGMRVVRDRAMNLKGAHAYAAVEPAAWRDAAVALRGDDVDAYFISCTATRSAEAIDAIETALERPAITSNQAMLWFALRSAGIEDKIDGFGRLLRAL